MYVRIAADKARPHNSLADLGMKSESNPIVSLGEFTYQKGKEIYGEKEPADYVYLVMQGAVRRHKLLSDGRRQIGGFHIEGDMFGLENGETHRFTAEAIVQTTVRLIRRESLEHVAQNDAVVFRDLLNLTTSTLAHAENHLLLLGRKTALERVAAFLLEMDERTAAVGVLSLPMTRRDIADYLGLTLETVSRAVSEFRREGMLAFAGRTHREITVLDRQRLAQFRFGNDAALWSKPVKEPDTSHQDFIGRISCRDGADVCGGGQ